MTSNGYAFKYINHYVAILIVFTFIPFFSFADSSACNGVPKTLRISLLIFNTEQRNAFEKIATDFERTCQNATVEYVSTNDMQYKEAAENWLRNDASIDVMLWPWPADLRNLIKEGFVEPVSDLWEQQHASFRDEVTFNGEQFGVPVSVGFWGLYVNKKVFDSLGITSLDTWQDLLSACQVLKDNNVIPIALGVKDKWPAIAWLDYFVLRMHGIDFYNALVNGDVPFTDEKIREVFVNWKALMDAGCFIKKPNVYSDKEVYPSFYRGRAGLLLSGNYFIGQIPNEVLDDIKFVPFPVINKSVRKYEVAPVDYFIIPANSNNVSLAKAFMAFLTQPSTLNAVNESIFFISPYSYTKAHKQALVNDGQINIASADGLTQYMDRVTPKIFYEPMKTALVNFIESGDIDRVILELEEARQDLNKQQ